jgi:hypothetical protein
MVEKKAMKPALAIPQRIWTALALSILLLATACSSPTPTPTLIPTFTPFLSKTPTLTPTFTETPTLTPIPSMTPTITQTPTVTPIPGADFTGAKLVKQGFIRQGYNYFVTLQLNGPATHPVYGIVDLNKKYACSQVPNNSNQLKCIGQLPGVDKYFTITIFDQQTDTQLFEQQFYIPMYY